MGRNSNIKVTVNYPETEEGMRELRERQARAVYTVLNKMLTPVQLDMLMERLKKDQLKG